MNMDVDSRNEKIDILRGVLILLVVVGHSVDENNLIKNVIFLFHMPLFFMISGLLFKEERFNYSYVLKKVKRLLFPYCFYAMITIFLTDAFRFRSILRYIWGGRKVTGVFWFSTCLFLSLIIFQFMLNNFNDKKIKGFLFVGAIAGIGESVLSVLAVLKIPDLPWNIDVCLMSLVYMAIGYYGKRYFMELLNNNEKKYNKILIVCIVLLIGILIWNWKVGKYNEILRVELDMKYVIYHGIVSAIIMPCVGAVIVCRAAWLIGFNRIKRFFSFCGRNTMPIMFLHIPINGLQIGGGAMTYILIGIGIPIILCLIIRRINYSKLLLLFGI